MSFQAVMSSQVMAVVCLRSSCPSYRFLDYSSSRPIRLYVPGDHHYRSELLVLQLGQKILLSLALFLLGLVRLLVSG